MVWRRETERVLIDSSTAPQSQMLLKDQCIWDLVASGGVVAACNPIASPSPSNLNYGDREMCKKHYRLDLEPVFSLSVETDSREEDPQQLETLMITHCMLNSLSAMISE